MLQVCCVRSFVHIMQYGANMQRQPAGSWDTSLANGAMTKRRWSKARPFPGRIVAVEGLCRVASADDKNTIRVEVDTSGSELAYMPGDALGVYPSNNPQACRVSPTLFEILFDKLRRAQAVRELLGVMGADADTPVPVPSWHYATQEAPASLSLEQALLCCYDIRSIL